MASEREHPSSPTALVYIAEFDLTNCTNKLLKALPSALEDY